MLNNSRPKLTKRLMSLVVLMACSIALQAAVPNGWLITGSKAADYESGTDAAAAHNGHPSAYLKSTTPQGQGFGTLMQDFRADHYLGKRERFSAFVKTEAAQDWAGLWMRVDKESKQVAFDNMQNQIVRAHV